MSYADGLSLYRGLFVCKQFAIAAKEYIKHRKLYNTVIIDSVHGSVAIIMSGLRFGSKLRLAQHVIFCGLKECILVHRYSLGIFVTRNDVIIGANRNNGYMYTTIHELRNVIHEEVKFCVKGGFVLLNGSYGNQIIFVDSINPDYSSYLVFTLDMCVSDDCHEYVISYDMDPYPILEKSFVLTDKCLLEVSDDDVVRHERISLKKF